MIDLYRCCVPGEILHCGGGREDICTCTWHIRGLYVHNIMRRFNQDLYLRFS